VQFGKALSRPFGWWSIAGEKKLPLVVLTITTFRCQSPDLCGGGEVPEAC
jgi:hypothetical protein